MYFQSIVNLGPFGDTFGCLVEAEFIPGDPDTGCPDEWDIFVTVEGAPVTYDISKTDRLRLIDEAIAQAKALADDAAIDRFEYDQEYDL